MVSGSCWKWNESSEFTCSDGMAWWGIFNEGVRLADDQMIQPQTSRPLARGSP